MKKQQGFGVVGVLIVIVVIAVVAGAGWFVYSKQKDNKADQPVAETTQQQPEATDLPAESQAHYFEIKELGVKFEQPASLKGLYYVIGNQGRTAYFSLTELEGTDCAADKTSQVALTRYNDADYATDPQAAYTKDKAKKMGDYYYSVVGGQAMCSEDIAVQTKATNMRMEVVKILPTALVPIQ